MKFSKLGKLNNKVYKSYPFFSPRHLLPIWFPYSTFGLSDKYLYPSKIMNVLSLNKSTLFGESGFVGHYQFQDNSKTIIHEGITYPMFVSVEINSVHKSEYADELLTVTDDNDTYGVEILEGWRYPEDHKDYWIHDWKSDNSPETGYLISEDDEYDNQVLDLIQRHINVENIYKELPDNMLSFTRLCKTEYYDFDHNGVTITFSVRYKSYVKEFLTEIKKWIRANKINYKL
jgi:predicted amino acid-binding ACT domain protein